MNKSSDEILLEKFISQYRWTLETAENVRNASKYWENRREEKSSMKNSKNIKIGDLVLVRNFSRSKLEPYCKDLIKSLIINYIIINVIKLHKFMIYVYEN